jgi:hypothetical protein
LGEVELVSEFSHARFDVTQPIIHSSQLAAAWAGRK